MTKKLYTLSVCFFCLLSFTSKSLNFRPSPVAVRDSLISFLHADKSPKIKRPATDIEEDEVLFSSNEKTFMLHHLTVQGSTVLKEEEIAPLYENLLGTEVSTAELGDLAEKLTDLYQAKGYVFSRVYVPFQNTTTGNIVLKAVEGSIEKISYRWINMPSNPELKALLEQIKDIKPFTTEALETILTEVQRLPGYAISLTLKPSKNQKGQGELNAAITRQAITYQGGVSDTMPRSIGKWVAQGAVNFNSLLGLKERIKLYGALYPTHKFNNLMFYGGEFAVPITQMGTNLLLHVDLMRNRPNLLSDGIASARGKLKTYGIGISQEILNTKGLLLKISTLIDRKKFTEATQTTAGVYSYIKERDLALRIASNLDYKDELWGDTKASLTYHQGLNDTWSRKLGENTPGNLSFSKLTAYGEHLHEILEDFTIFGLLRGQYSLTTPIEMERFFYGGGPFAFANPVGALSGDSGIHGKLEVRYGFTLNDLIKKLIAYTYYEHGRIWNRASRTDVRKRESLSAVGLGVRGNLNNGLSVFLEYGIPFRTKLNQLRMQKKLFAGISFNNQYGS